MSKITKGRLYPVWHRMLYSCTHMTTVGVKGSIIFIADKISSIFLSSLSSSIRLDSDLDLLKLKPNLVRSSDKSVHCLSELAVCSWCILYTGHLFLARFLFVSLYLSVSRVWAPEHCRVSPPRFLAECHKRQLNQASFVLLCFVLFAFLGCV